MADSIAYRISGSKSSSTESILNRLSLELRIMIFTMCLVLGPGLEAPPFLIAMAHDTALFAEAVAIYKSINYAITKSTRLPFKKLSGLKLHDIRHLTVAFEDMFLGNVINSHDLRSSHAHISNSIQTLTVDVSRVTVPHDGNLDPHSVFFGNTSFFMYLQAASRKGIWKLELVMDATRHNVAEQANFATTVLGQLSWVLGTTCRVTIHSAGGGALGVLTFEAIGDGKLRFDQ